MSTNQTNGSDQSIATGLPLSLERNVIFYVQEDGDSMLPVPLKHYNLQMTRHDADRNRCHGASRGRIDSTLREIKSLHLNHAVQTIFKGTKQSPTLYTYGLGKETSGSVAAVTALSQQHASQIKKTTWASIVVSLQRCLLAEKIACPLSYLGYIELLNVNPFDDPNDPQPCVTWIKGGGGTMTIEGGRRWLSLKKFIVNYSRTNVAGKSVLRSSVV